MKGLKILLAIVLAIVLTGTSCNKEKPGDITLNLNFIKAVNGDVLIKVYDSEDNQINDVSLQETSVSFVNVASQQLLFADLAPNKTYIFVASATIDGTDYIGTVEGFLESKGDITLDLALTGNGSFMVLVKADGNFVCNAEVKLFESQDKLLKDDWMAKGITGPDCEKDGAVFKNLKFAQYHFRAIWTNSAGKTYYGVRNDVWANKDEDKTFTMTVTQ